MRDIHTTLWHKSRQKKAGAPEGWGVSLYAEGEIGRYVPFVRLGHSEGIGEKGTPAALNDMAAAGVGLTDIFGQDHDVLGIGFGWGRRDKTVGDPLAALKRTDQYSAELFYRVQVTELLEVTPDVQVFWDPTSNPAEDTIAVFGLRARVVW